MWPRMGRYRFHIRSRDGICHDDEGVEAPSVEAARTEAVRGARSIIADDVTHGRLDLKAQIEVADEAGSTVAVIPFEDVIEITR
jgi:hypothetical protein